MGNLKSKYTAEEWDELVKEVNKEQTIETKPGFVERRLSLALEDAAEDYVSRSFDKKDLYQAFKAGAAWMLRSLK
jgi:hypothetical protein